MVSSATVAVVGTLMGSIAGASITGILNYYNTKQSQMSQDRRQRAEFYLDKKVTYLTDLYDALLRCDFLIRGISGTANEDRWKVYHEKRSESEVQELLEELEIAVRRASIFFEDEEQKAMSTVMIRTAGLFQDLSIGEAGINNSDFIMDEYLDSMDKAKNILRNEISSPVGLIVEQDGRDNGIDALYGNI